MISTIDYKLVNAEEFAIELPKYRDVVNGKGPAIAQLAKVPYRTFTNAKSGRVKNPAILGSILRAIKIVYNETLNQYAK